MQDNYPELTFCIEGGHLNDLGSEIGLSKTNISNILKGSISSDRRKQYMDEKLIGLDNEMHFRTLKDILTSYSFITNNNSTTYQRDDSNIQEQNTFFPTSHTGPNKQKDKNY